MRTLPHTPNIRWPEQPYNYLRRTFPELSQSGLHLLNGLLTYDASKRMSAAEALEHEYFRVCMQECGVLLFVQGCLCYQMFLTMAVHSCAWHWGRMGVGGLVAAQTGRQMWPSLGLAPLTYTLHVCVHVCCGGVLLGICTGAPLPSPPR